MHASQRSRSPVRPGHKAVINEQELIIDSMRTVGPIAFKLAGTISLIGINVISYQTTEWDIDRNNYMVKVQKPMPWIEVLCYLTVFSVALRVLFGDHGKKDNSPLVLIPTIFDRSMKWLMLVALSFLATSEVVGPRVRPGHAYTLMAGASLIPFVFLNEGKPMKYLKDLMLLIFNATAYGVVTFSKMGTCDAQRDSRVMSSVLSLCLDDFEARDSNFIHPDCQVLVDNGYVTDAIISAEEAEKHMTKYFGEVQYLLSSPCYLDTIAGPAKTILGITTAVLICYEGGKFTSYLRRKLEQSSKRH